MISITLLFQQVCLSKVTVLILRDLPCKRITEDNSIAIHFCYHSYTLEIVPDKLPCIK